MNKINGTSRPLSGVTEVLTVFRMIGIPNHLMVTLESELAKDMAYGIMAVELCNEILFILAAFFADMDRQTYDATGSEVLFRMNNLRAKIRLLVDKSAQSVNGHTVVSVDMLADRVAYPICPKGTRITKIAQLAARSI